MTFSSDSQTVAEEEKAPTSSHLASADKLAQIIKQAEDRHATPGALKRLKEGRLSEAHAWLRGCCMFDLAREVEGVISGGAA